MADRIGLESLDREGQRVVLKFRQDAKLDPAMLLKLVQSRGDLTLLPPAVLRLDLTADPRRARAGAASRSGEGRLVARPAPAEAGPGVPLAARRPPGGSWWTARATRRCQPGFTKGEILAEAPLDPAAPGGLFERLGQLLEQLSQSLVATARVEAKILIPCHLRLRSRGAGST